MCGSLLRPGGGGQVSARLAGQQSVYIGLDASRKIVDVRRMAELES